MSLLPQLIGFSEQNGQWFAEDVSLKAIALEFGTPCYVYSKRALVHAFSAYDKACYRKDGSRRARVHYAMKANSNLAILNIFSKREIPDFKGFLYLKKVESIIFECLSA